MAALKQVSNEPCSDIQRLTLSKLNLTLDLRGDQRHRWK